MRSKNLIALAISTALSVMPAGTNGAATEELTVEELASYGLTLEEFNKVRNSESPSDFGGLPSSGDTDQLWLDAAVFEYEVATSDSSDRASTSSGYHPYLVCSTYPGLSGKQREAQIDAIFQNTPNVSASHYYTSGNIFHNNDDISCGTLRAYNDTIAKVYESNPNATEYMSVNPLHPSMKMAENTVEIMESWFEGEDAGDVVTIGSDSGNSDEQIQVKTLGLHMILCPGVQDFEVEDVPDDEIADDVKSFVTEDGGNTVKEMSFYYHRVSGMDGKNAVHTERMGQWSEAISQVTNWTKDDGSNDCLDSIIGENMSFVVKQRILEVNAKMSFWEGKKLIQSLGRTQDDLNTCIWYMTYALALDPMVCTLEPRTSVKTLCKNGSSDLSQCSEVDAVVPPAADAASGRIEVGPWKMNIAVMTLLVSLLGVVIL
mmetsp:Transcript_42752/g.76909  ORF Transcript_42752/g.76909 Transcript_42752/m.76909 type:complete len:431 (+) Transcript_42752:234-1526(+)